MKANNTVGKQTSREHSGELIHKQIEAFERLLQHSMSRFSKENLYHMLTHVTRWADEDNKKSSKSSSNIAFKLNSIEQLRAIVTLARQTRNVKNTEDELVFKNYELFLNDLLYLRDLKKYFDDEIHKKLQTYHIDPNLLNGSLELNESVGDIRYEYLGNSDPIEPKTKPADAKHKDDSGTFNHRNRLKETVNELNVILKKWQGLLTDDTLELNDFDPDSYHELMKFSRYSQFEPLLRLIPDIFAKCYKCIDLSKRWLEDVNVLLKDEPVTSTPVPDFSTDTFDEDPAHFEEKQKVYIKQIRDLQSQIEEMNKTIDESETQLLRYNQEMDVLVRRDERFVTVSSECDKIDSLITVAAGDYQKAKTEQYAVASKLRGCTKGSQTYAELKSHLKRLDTEVSQNHWKMKLLEFEKATVQEDYLVEMEVRPSFIRFVGDTKDKINDLESLLRVRKEEKLKLEKQLALTKTNTERMRKIMRTYLGSASSIGERSKTFDSSPRSPDLASDKNDADGNEADDDSSSQGSGKESVGNGGKMSPSDNEIMRTPRLVKNKPATKRDLRPFSEGSGQPRVRAENRGRDSPAKICSRGPRAALKTHPKRVWEFV